MVATDPSQTVPELTQLYLWDDHFSHSWSALAEPLVHIETDIS